MSIFEKMTLDEKIEYKLAEAEEKTLREANKDLVERMNSLSQQIEINAGKVSNLSNIRVKLVEKYS